MRIKTIVITVVLFTLTVVARRGRAAEIAIDDRPIKKVAGSEWLEFSKPELVKISKQVLALPDIPLKAKEEILRGRALEMDWDITAMIYEPQDSSKIPTGADGKKVGLLLLHGGSGDHRSMDRFARFLVSKFGYKIVNMSYPGRPSLPTLPAKAQKSIAPGEG